MDEGFTCPRQEGGGYYSSRARGGGGEGKQEEEEEEESASLPLRLRVGFFFVSTLCAVCCVNAGVCFVVLCCFMLCCVNLCLACYLPPSARRPSPTIPDNFRADVFGHGQHRCRATKFLKGPRSALPYTNISQRAQHLFPQASHLLHTLSHCSPDSRA